MKRPLLLFIGVAFFLSSCDRLSGLGYRVKEKAKSTVDRFFPTYESKVGDTDYNKKRFKEFFGFYPTDDVKNLYAYADELGVDASYYFSFNCNEQTVERIIKELELQKDTANRSSVIGFDLPYTWWNTERIDKLEPVLKIEKNIHWYLWHDREKNQAYFLTLDI
ncbi:hypothetical protein [Pontibacter rugosus]|uniref:Lipoprotein n=1 Tax=Pontibacter rugosus TaxID=1745966 RepID=A0ABW3SL64_9BACT